MRNGNPDICENYHIKPSVIYNEIMEFHANRNFNVNFYSSLLNKRQEQLYRDFMSDYGICPSRFIENVKLEVALNLLQYTYIKLIEIALTTGYKSDIDLVRVFKRRFGQTPGNIRNTIVNSNKPENKIKNMC